MSDQNEQGKARALQLNEHLFEDFARKQPNETASLDTMVARDVVSLAVQAPIRGHAGWKSRPRMLCRPRGHAREA